MFKIILLSFIVLGVIPLDSFAQTRCRTDSLQNTTCRDSTYDVTHIMCFNRPEHRPVPKATGNREAQLLGGPLEAMVSPHTMPSRELRVFVPEGDNNQPSAPQLSMTVTQNVDWNDALADLC